MAVQFDAVGDSYNRSGNLLGVGAFTVAGWFRLDSDRNNFTSLVSVDDGTANYWFMGTDADGTTVRLDSAGTTTGGSTMVVGQWHYVGVTYDGSSVAKFYFGTLYGGALSETTGTATDPSNSGATTWIGADAGGVSGDQFLGSVAYVRIWAAALTLSELEDERVSRTPVRTSNLTARYDFNGPSTTDDSGNANTLTANGTPAAAGSPWVTGTHQFGNSGKRGI